MIVYRNTTKVFKTLKNKYPKWKPFFIKRPFSMVIDGGIYGIYGRNISSSDTVTNSLSQAILQGYLS